MTLTESLDKLVLYLRSEDDGEAADLVEQAIASHARMKAELEGLREALREAEAEARRIAGFYPDASDGRNTLVILADKIATLSSGGASE